MQGSDDVYSLYEMLFELIYTAQEQRMALVMFKAVMGCYMCGPIQSRDKMPLYFKTITAE